METVKYSIPEITDERITELQKKLTPLIRREKNLYIAKKTDPRNQAFSWNDGEKRVRHLKEVARFKTLHTYGYHGFFKPSLAEVFAQLPTELEDIGSFFEVKGPEDASDLNKEQEALNAGFHVAETILYKHISEDVPKRDGSVDRATFYRMGAEERLESTSWIIECGSSSDHDYLWERYYDNPNPEYNVKVKSWEDLSAGFMLTVGYFGEHQVCISLQWTKIAGKWVCFYYPTSQVVDHRMIDKWMRENFESMTSDGRWAHTDVLNFGHCLFDIEAYEKD